MNKSYIHTLGGENVNLDNKLPNISVYDCNEEQIDLHTLKVKKVYLSIPSFANPHLLKELNKLDEAFKDYPRYHFYVISNEPVYTQNRLLKRTNLKTFKHLSDFKNRDFARHTGTLIYELGQLVKAIIIVDEDDYVKYVKYYDDLYEPVNIDALKKELD